MDASCKYRPLSIRELQLIYAVSSLNTFHAGICDSTSYPHAPFPGVFVCHSQRMSPAPWHTFMLVLWVQSLFNVSRTSSNLQCIHRDLKGENLLLTSNDRVKVTDFGFARIASRNAEEMKRMTYCGTDVSLLGSGHSVRAHRAGIHEPRDYQWL